MKLKSRLFSRLFLVLSLCLGVAQVIVAHWLVVVLAGREGPGFGLGLALAALLVAANGVASAVLRWARRRGAWPRRLARAYVGLGLATLLLAAAVGVSWVGWLPLAGLAALLDPSGETAFLVFRVGSTVAVGALAAMLIWGFTGGRHTLDRSRVRVEVRGLHRDHRGLRIVQLSDLHIGNGLEGKRLSAVLEAANSLDADLIALTGDLFDFDPGVVEEGARGLASLRARCGVYAVLGNHDTYTGTEIVASALARHAPNITLLRDAIVKLPLDPPLYLAGVEDPGREWISRSLELPALEEVAAARPDDGPTLLLVHRPEAFPQAARLGFPLVLAGHTHGGQLAFPTPGGRINFAALITRFTRGLYRENGAALYVNRGVGFAGPMIRFNCRREITTIELA